MDLLQAYRQEIERRDLIEDQVQIEAVERLQRLAIDMERYERSRAGLLTRLFSKQKAPKGLWLWGGVGRGKSFIMDLFFESLDVERKGRFHFHEFMREVHRELEVHKGQANPLDSVGLQIAQRYQILFLMSSMCLISPMP